MGRRRKKLKIYSSKRLELTEEEKQYYYDRMQSKWRNMRGTRSVVG